MRVGSQGSYRPSTLTVRLHVSSQRCRAKRWVRVSPRAHTDTSVCGQVLSRSQVCLLGTLCARDTLIACSSSHAPAECVGGSQRERHSVRVILRRIDRDAWMTKGGGISDHGQAPERRRSLSPGSGRRGRGAAPWASGWASATICRRVGCWDQGHLGRRDPWIWVILTVRRHRHAAPLASRVSPSRATASPPEPCHRANRRHRPGSRSPTGRRAAPCRRAIRRTSGCPPASCLLTSPPSRTCPRPCH